MTRPLRYLIAALIASLVVWPLGLLAFQLFVDWAIGFPSNDLWGTVRLGWIAFGPFVFLGVMAAPVVRAALFDDDESQDEGKSKGGEGS